MSGRPSFIQIIKEAKKLTVIYTEKGRRRQKTGNPEEALKILRDPGKKWKQIRFHRSKA